MRKIITLVCVLLLPLTALAEGQAAAPAIDLTPIFQAVITLLAALMTYRLVPWIKSKTSAQQQVNLQAVINILVYAAEQVYGAGNGAHKLNYVTERLKAAGYDLNAHNIMEMIEASVKSIDLAAPPQSPTTEPTEAAG